MSVDQPWLLVLLLACVLPWLGARPGATGWSWLGLVPVDRLSDALWFGLRTCASLAIALAVLGLAGLHLGERSVERIGRGAEVVLLLDRSRSMDQPFTRSDGGGYTESGDSKAVVAQRALAEFASKRPHDQFAMLVFSTAPIPVLDFTDKPSAIQAAIRAARIGRGLADTDMGRALISALALFEHRPYAGSRLILLVSDGGAHLDEDTRQAITEAARRHRVGLYWIYIRSAFGPKLTGEEGADENPDAVPERFLHRYFQTIGTPYRAYQSDDPAALGRAVADVDRLERLPIAFRDQLPRRDLARVCFALAALLCLPLIVAARLEQPAW